MNASGRIQAIDTSLSCLDFLRTRGLVDLLLKVTAVFSKDSLMGEVHFKSGQFFR